MNSNVQSERRAVEAGGAGGAVEPPDFLGSINPIQTRGTDYYLPSPPPGFSELPTTLERTSISM